MFAELARPVTYFTSAAMLIIGRSDSPQRPAGIAGRRSLRHFEHDCGKRRGCIREFALTASNVMCWNRSKRRGPQRSLASNARHARPRVAVHLAKSCAVYFCVRLQAEAKRGMYRGK
jgi:hypothetical protein